MTAVRFSYFGCVSFKPFRQVVELLQSCLNGTMWLFVMKLIPVKLFCFLNQIGIIGLVGKFLTTNETLSEVMEKFDFSADLLGLLSYYCLLYG